MPPEIAPSATTTAVTATGDAFSLDPLSERYGAACSADVDDYVAAGRNDLIARGRRVAPESICADAARIYGLADDFLRRATPAQREELVAVTEDLLRVALWSARRARDLSRGLRPEATPRELPNAAADGLRRRALVRREQLHAVLDTLSGQDHALLAQIEVAYGTASTATALADSLSTMATYAHRFLKDHSPAARRRLKGTRLTLAWLDQTEALAAELLASSDAVAPWSQGCRGEIDYWDGVNLFFLAKIIDAFETAHSSDETIPRLVPLSLRSVLGRTAKSPDAATPDTPSPAAPPPRLP